MIPSKGETYMIPSKGETYLIPSNGETYMIPSKGETYINSQFEYGSRLVFESDCITTIYS